MCFDSETSLEGLQDAMALNEVGETVGGHGFHKLAQATGERIGPKGLRRARIFLRLQQGNDGGGKERAREFSSRPNGIRNLQQKVVDQGRGVSQELVLNPIGSTSFAWVEALKRETEFSQGKVGGEVCIWPFGIKPVGDILFATDPLFIAGLWRRCGWM